MEQEHKPTVLLVEADDSLRRLITLGLQHRGMDVIEAETTDTLSCSGAQVPSVLVLDIDRGIQRDWSLLAATQSRLDLPPLPVIVLTWDDPASTEESTVATVVSSQVVCVEKPFDARVLHEKIDDLLAAKTSAEAALKAEQEARLLASYNRQTSPSIWPIITAAGLLVMVVGLMLQFAITAVGVIIVVVGLLLWTLGTKPETEQVAALAIPRRCN